MGPGTAACSRPCVSWSLGLWLKWKYSEMPSIPSHTPSAHVLKQCPVRNDAQQVSWKLPKKQVPWEVTGSTCQAKDK